MFQCGWWRLVLYKAPVVFVRPIPTAITHRKFAVSRCLKKAFEPRIALKPSVENDVVLYQHENSKFFRKLFILAIMQNTMWSYLAYFGYNLSDSINEQKGGKNTKWSVFGLFDVSLKSGTAKIMCVGSFILGCGVTSAVLMYILRSVSLVVLRKGGKLVTFQTYYPIKGKREFTVPIEQVSGVQSRTKSKVYFPLRLKNKLFYFLLDMEGQFSNPFYFDRTIALKRDLK